MDSGNAGFLEDLNRRLLGLYLDLRAYTPEGIIFGYIPFLSNFSWHHANNDTIYTLDLDSLGFLDRRRSIRYHITGGGISKIGLYIDEFARGNHEYSLMESADQTICIYTMRSKDKRLLSIKMYPDNLLDGIVDAALENRGNQADDFAESIFALEDAVRPYLRKMEHRDLGRLADSFRDIMGWYSH